MTTIGVAVHRMGARRTAPRDMGVRAVDASGASVGRTDASSGRVRTRLTRRGRVVLTALVVLPALVFGGVVVANSAAAAGAGSSFSASFRHVTVQPGQSLWLIAQRVAPKSDPRDVVGAIVDLNGLSSSVVQAGQRLAIPHQYDSSAH